MDYMNAKEAADKWGLSVRRVQVLCEQGRVDGVEPKVQKSRWTDVLVK